MDLKKQAMEIEALVKLTRGIVGVKLVHSEEEFCRFNGIDLLHPLSFCVAVKCASLGHSIKLKRQMGGCKGSNRALGLCECGPEYKSGDNGCRLGLYGSKEIASNVACAMPICSDDTYGVIIKPLGLFEEKPDVVLMFSNPREGMRMMQGYTYVYGVADHINISGNQAVCVEATVTPMKTNQINVSLLCSGTRYHAGWSDNELLAGLPADKLEGFIQGLKGTVNAIEMDDRKKEIEESLRQINCLDFKINYGKTYFK